MKNKGLKKSLKISGIISLLAFAIFFGYCNNTSLANPKTVAFYDTIKKKLVEKGYKTNLLVISTKRFAWHNWIQVWLSGAAKNSQHKEGNAIDFLVFDVNNDGTANSTDIDIVYKILDEEVIQDKGGTGTYKTDKHTMNRKMVHIDCNGKRTRWNR